MNSEFVHLHTHTEHSLLDGINRINEIPSYVKNQLGQNALSITDHGTLSGLYTFYKKCKEEDVKPILGIEAYYTQDRLTKGTDANGRNFYHIILLALNNTGLKNLFKLHHDASLNGFYYKPRVDTSTLFEHSEGIAITTACLGSFTSRMIAAGNREGAKAWLKEHAGVFRDRMFVELQLHHNDEQRGANAAMMAMAKELNLPTIVTNDSHYTTLQDKHFHHLALSMNTDGETESFNFNSINVHLADYDYILKEVREHGLPEESIANTAYLANLVDANDYFSDVKNRYPRFKEIPEDLSSHIALKRFCMSQLYDKFDGNPPAEYLDRLRHELKIIKKMGFSDYMLIIWRYIVAARELNVATGPGRGSAAGSLVCYLLRMTALDPIKYDLMFERFLNPGRSAIPMHFDASMKHQIKCC